jgi:hypothetical protein
MARRHQSKPDWRFTRGARAPVQFCVVDAQLALAGEGLRGERLVQLEQVETVEGRRLHQASGTREEELELAMLSD